MCLLSVFCSLVYKSKYSTWIRLRLPLITFDFSETILNLHEHRLIHIYIWIYVLLYLLCFAFASHLRQIHVHLWKLPCYLLRLTPCAVPRAILYSLNEVVEHTILCICVDLSFIVGMSLSH